MKLLLALVFTAAVVADANTVWAQSTSSDPAIDACQASGLIALKERSASVKDLIFDPETLLISKANTRVEDVPVRTVIMGEAYLEKKSTGKPQRFVCLIGEKGKVLLTFFMTP